MGNIIYQICYDHTIDKKSQQEFFYNKTSIENFPSKSSASMNDAQTIGLAKSAINLTIENDVASFNKYNSECLEIITLFKQRTSVKKIQKVFKSFLNMKKVHLSTILNSNASIDKSKIKKTRTFSTISLRQQNSCIKSIVNKPSKLKFRNSIYIGFVMNKVPHGFGILTNNDGCTYTGNWCKGVGNGVGRYSTKNSFKYEGYFYKDKQHSYGIEIENGYSLEAIEEVLNKYEGEYYHGVKAGIGIIENKDYIYCGDFEKNNINGFGEILFKSNQKSYIGEWKNNKMHGIGALFWKNGNSHYGNFIHNSREGFGIFSTEKSIFIGNWENSKLEKEGIIIDINEKTKKLIKFENSKIIKEIPGEENRLYITIDAYNIIDFIEEIKKEYFKEKSLDISKIV